MIRIGGGRHIGVGAPWSIHHLLLVGGLTRALGLEAGLKGVLVKVMSKSKQVHSPFAVRSFAADIVPAFPGASSLYHTSAD